MVAGQLAVRLDPSDNALDHELKDISAQRAMDAGGYEKAAGKEGGFRTFVKDEPAAATGRSRGDCRQRQHGRAQPHARQG